METGQTHGSRCVNAGRSELFFAAVMVGGLLVASSRHATATGVPITEPPCGYDYVVITGGTDGWGFPISVYPDRINNLGEIAGRRKIALATGLPFTWTSQTGLVPLPKPAGVPEVEIFGLNDNGWLILESQVPTYRAFIIPYEARATAQWIKIEPLKHPGGSHARGINNLNQVVGHRTRAGVPPSDLLPYSGFIWSPETGETQEILVNDGGQPSCGVYAINDAGTMLGWSSQSALQTYSTKTFLLENEQQMAIPTPHRSAGMMPRDLNQQGYGLIVERLKVAPELGGILLFSHLTKDGELLCDLPAAEGFLWGEGFAINAHGVVAGVSSTPSSLGGGGVGTVWFNGVPYSPTELAGIEPGSPDSVGALIDINDKGQLLGQTKSLTRIILLTPSGVQGDLDCDGEVGAADVAVMLGSWGPGSPRADIDLNGVVDGVDLGLLLSAWSG